ncbi:MAG: 2-phospho-L-lactate guanylyltransferase [Micromonosporaceae bacterium]|nr:2-phospho-L-lactate guanylyltransferase [Micromonosporaceae bacterium]
MDDLWIAVIPVKPPGTAKQRLRPVLSDRARIELVVAMALDTIAATRACHDIGTVVVVCDDAEIRDEASRLGATVVPDAPLAGLNAAVLHGALAAGDRLSPVAALPADLPAVRPAELSEALRAAAKIQTRGDSTRTGAFVPDTSSTGTVLLAAPAVAALSPEFGPGSAAAHRAAGLHCLDGNWPGLRCDVDTSADLTTASALGLGPRTRALLARAGGYGG